VLFWRDGELNVSGMPGFESVQLMRGVMTDFVAMRGLMTDRFGSLCDDLWRGAISVGWFWRVWSSCDAFWAGFY
jgi:hypothetical protein